MNIKEAKNQVKKTIELYLTKDKFGRYEIPMHKQRPLFLMGPPGIGKTEIMSQVASELGIGLLSYSMTHHTRQSAIGLPIIKKKSYGGKEYDVSEYTMSEIIASIHNMIEDTGKDTGILFLDEINCVSETLSPIMLQFLQYKVFGGHKVPEGWVVVTAGNPPEYNNSVHEFDIVTWDRLKRIDIEPDFDVWKEYAYEVGVNPAIITYLENKKGNFYHIEQNVDGKTFVTARGWDDLSRFMNLCEKKGMTIDRHDIEQYLHNEKISRDFAVYYDLYKKYQSDYKIDKIIAGDSTKELIERSKEAPYDEKFTVVGLLIEVLGNDAKEVISKEEVLLGLQKKLKPLEKSSDLVAELTRLIEEIDSDLTVKRNSNSLGNKEYDNALMSRELLMKYIDAVKKSAKSFHGEGVSISITPWNALQIEFNKDANEHKKKIAESRMHYSNAFKFCDEAFGEDSQQLLILCTEMVANTHISYYIATKGCDEYFKHDELLMFHKRNVEIIKELETLEELENL